MNMFKHGIMDFLDKHIRMFGYNTELAYNTGVVYTMVMGLEESQEFRNSWHVENNFITNVRVKNSSMGRDCVQYSFSNKMKPILELHML